MPSLANERVLPADDLRADMSLATRGKPPPSRPKRLIQNTAVFNLGKIHEAVWLNNIQFQSH